MKFLINFKNVSLSNFNMLVNKCLKFRKIKEKGNSIIIFLLIKSLLQYLTLVIYLVVITFLKFKAKLQKTIKTVTSKERKMIY